MPIINGTPGDDTLIGTEDADEINGFGGNDNLIGEGGGDTLNGGDDHDFMTGGDGNDQLFGGLGDDFLRGDLGDDIIDGQGGIDRAAYAIGAVGGVTVDLNLQGVAQNTGSAGIDTLFNIEHLSGTQFSDVLTGDGGDNWLWGGSNGTGVTGDDTISAGGGNDLVWVGTGNHTLDGGSGNDTLSFFGNQTDITAAGVTASLALQGTGDQDTEQGLMELAGFENLSGSIHADSLTGDGNDNILLGDIGDDTLFGGAGNDTLYGDGRTTVDTHGLGLSGPIVTYADVSLLPFAGAPGDDVLDGGTGDDTLDGGGGNDTASYASQTAAVLALLEFGQAFEDSGGTDTLIGIENLIGSDFDDSLLGDAGANMLDGGDGHDLLRGRDGDDSLLGGEGDDFLNGDEGDDILDGGNGLDRVSYFLDATAGVTVDLNIQGVSQATGQGSDTLISIEHVSGTSFADTLIGNVGDNWLWAIAGADMLSAGAGNDLVQVGAGAVTADGSIGVDTLSFGGDTTLSGITTAGVTISLDDRGAVQDTEQGLMTLTGFENLSGSNFDDELTGDDGDNLLAGDSGNDMLDGGDGDDILLGDGRIAADTHGVGTSGPIVTVTDVGLGVFPGPVGNDVLDGGRGEDVLNGGGGDDELTGGQGLDIFAFGPASGDDVVTDFRNDQDRIRFEGIAGVDDFSDLTLTRIGGDVLISWGDGSDSILLEHTNIRHIDASDFLFI